MTSYQGGKKRIGKKIYDAISCLVEDLDKNMPYFEPFCGMCSVLIHAVKDRSTLACDINPDLIMLLKAIRDEWIPPIECSKEKYNELKSAPSSPERGFIGIAASFNCAFFNGGYRLGYKSHHNFLKEASDGLMSIKEQLKKTGFLEPRDYTQHNPHNMVIYADPPYKGNNLKSKFFSNFDHDKFWDTMRLWSKDNVVVISELQAPSDFIKIWKYKTIVQNVTKTKRFSESLYLHESLLYLLNERS